MRIKPSTTTRTRMVLATVLVAAIATFVGGSAGATGGLPDGYVGLATPYKLVTGINLAAHGTSDKVVTGGATTVPSYASSVLLTLSVKSGKAAGDLLVYPTGSPDGVVALHWAAGQAASTTATVRVGLKNEVRFENQSTGTVNVTSTITAYAGEGAQGPQGTTGATGATGSTGSTGPQGPQGIAGPQGPAGSGGSAAIAFRQITNASSAATLASVDGWTFSAACSPTDGSTTQTGLGIYVTPPTGVTFNARGQNPWLTDTAGTSGTQILASTGLSGAQLVAGNKVAVGHFLNQWSAPTLVSGSDGNSFSLEYAFTVSAQATLPAGGHRCDLEGVLIPAS
ncbi:MAG TPA: hypothetical protein VFE15_04125 [Marmoricola sp.]|jgi:hypothetical protein|nr:hypothetical protein [Marmoricola sp.]